MRFAFLIPCVISLVENQLKFSGRFNTFGQKLQKKHVCVGIIFLYDLAGDMCKKKGFGPFFHLKKRRFRVINIITIEVELYSADR